jgi:hypothetical protein
VRLRSLVDYQGLIDLRPLEADQRKRIAADPRYPDALYVPQRFRDLHTGPDVRAGLLEQVITWLDVDGPRFVIVLGDFGRGKTFLLRQLARHVPRQLPTMLPVLVELHGLEKAPSLDELLAQHLVRHGMQNVELPKLRYMIESGRLALLFDGFDELALRVSYDHAADYLQTLLAAATGNAKIVLTSRTQHFQSTTQVRTALGDRVAALAGNRIAVIEDFTDDQIREFLVNHYDGDNTAAQARFRLLDQIQDLLGLSHNPRMLSFIADLDEARLHDIQRRRGVISAAGLYEEIVGSWLRHEAMRQQHRGGLPSLDERERHDACSALALRLWASTSPTIPVADLSSEVAATLTGLAERGYATEEAAQAVGSGTLLVSTADGSFTFVHPSVMEWLVAETAAQRLRAGESATMLAARRMSRLMADFLYDLADHDTVALWAAGVLSDATATETAKQNALDLMARLDRDANPESRGATPVLRADLVGTDLRGQDLTGTDLRRANLSNANLRGMRLERTDLRRANLRGADFTGAKLLECRLDDADITGSHWGRAAIVGTEGVSDLANAPELNAAAIANRDRSRVMIVGRSLNAIAFSPDGLLLATASSDRAAQVWDIATGTIRATVAGDGPVYAVAFSPDSQFVATANDHRVSITDIFRVRGVVDLVHPNVVNAVAFSPDGGLIAATSYDGTARIWDTTTGQPRTTLIGHTSTVRGVAFSPDGALIATASDDNTARLWDATTGSPISLIRHPGTVRSVAFSPDGTLIATASNDNTARTWTPTTGVPHATLTGHNGPVNAVTFSPDGTLIATASDDNTAWLWDATTGSPLTVSEHPNAVRDIVFSPDGTLLAMAGHNGTVRLWDVNSSRELATLVPFPRTGYAVLLPDGSYKLDGDPGNTLWWAIKLCRFAPGELDPYVPEIHRLPADAQIFPF